MKTRPMKVRVYRTQVDDSGKMMWLAEAGEPLSGGGWIVFAEAPLAENTKQEALAALTDVLRSRARRTSRALRALAKARGGK